MHSMQPYKKGAPTLGSPWGSERLELHKAEFKFQIDFLLVYYGTFTVNLGFLRCKVKK